MPFAARLLDMHTCPMSDGPKPHVGGPVAAGAPTVLIGFQPAARVGDAATCVGPPDVIAQGEPTVLIGDMPAARMGDTTAHGGKVVMGCPTVHIGSGAQSQALRTDKPFCEQCHSADTPRESESRPKKKKKRRAKKRRGGRVDGDGRNT